MLSALASGEGSLAQTGSAPKQVQTASLQVSLPQRSPHAKHQAPGLSQVWDQALLGSGMTVKLLQCLATTPTGECRPLALSGAELTARIPRLTQSFDTLRPDGFLLNTVQFS